MQSLTSIYANFDSQKRGKKKKKKEEKGKDKPECKITRIVPWYLARSIDLHSTTLEALKTR